MLSAFHLRPLDAASCTSDLLNGFEHRQIITQRWQRDGGAWKLMPADELHEWSDGKRRWIPSYLLDQIRRGGYAVGAFADGALIGFAAIDGERISGSVNLTMLFVDDRYHRMGAGRALFRELCRRAAEAGAQRLFISAISSAETVAFYFSMGCTDAETVVPDFVDTESDRCLEYLL